MAVSPRQFLKELVAEIEDDDVFNGAAALAFYLTLAIFPAVIFLMALIPYLPVERVDEALMDLLFQLMPGSAAQMFSGVVEEVTREQRGGLLSFGIVATVWAASSGMVAVMQQLNVTYDVKERRNLLQVRLVGIGLSLLFAVLVLGGFTLIVTGGLIQDALDAYWGSSPWLLGFFAGLRWVIIVLGLLLAFALIYYLGPDVEQRFVFITPGSVLGVVLLALASLGFSWYAANFADYSATYGSVGAVIVLMLWLYLTGIVILLGSEINALVEHHAASGKIKGEHAAGDRLRDPAQARRAARADPARDDGERRAAPP